MNKIKQKPKQKSSSTMSTKGTILLYEQMLKDGDIDHFGSAYRRYIELINRRTNLKNLKNAVRYAKKKRESVLGE